ncbi:flavonol 4'-sulfotransferase [Artemisia annua]|uniref:Sulfotransferase n=1 Tax=Artemisia annua TaxID=35608 RepID=A0A2U1MFF5_ARTAN|nr:flavonol 4'-sulfotransferase [Artemisia annua]
MEEIVKTLPQHTSSWSKGRLSYYMHEGFWSINLFHGGVALNQQRYKAQPNVVLCSSPKTGTTWLKALAFAIVTQNKFGESNSPLLTTFTHDFIPHFEFDLKQNEENQKNSSFPLAATHLPYASLPKSIVSSNCKIVYIYRNIKDVIVSHYHFVRELIKLPVEDAPFEDVYRVLPTFLDLIMCLKFTMLWFCESKMCVQSIECKMGQQGLTANELLLIMKKASLERTGTILFLKYEDLKRDPMGHVKTLAEFIGYPCSREEEDAGVIENIINLKATDGDWENYFTEEMKEKIDKLIYQKMSGTGLILT